jgi:TrmH family RNA methyltransferase
MIPLYKLEKLPRTQKLRKIAKVFSMAENRLCSASEKSVKIFSADEIVFFNDAVKLLAKDSFFSHNAQKVFNEASQLLAKENDAASLRRALNIIKHLLLSETGKEQADWDFTDSEGMLDSKKRHVIEGMYVYLEDIRSPFNVGAMFRTAESFSVEKIILSPFCADPRHTRAERTAMGCIDIVPWERCERSSLELCLSGLISSEGLPIFALETGGTPLDEFNFPARGILVAGSEELGVSPQTLALADASLGRVSIPCFGTKASLNVSVAFGIALQAWRASLHAKRADNKSASRGV